jgi:hypothetical protein
MKNTNRTLNIVAFCILMENNGGILTKHPGYVLEKFERYCGSDEMEWMWGLDAVNFKKLKKWLKTWVSDQRYKELLKLIEEWRGEK